MPVGSSMPSTKSGCVLSGFSWLQGGAGRRAAVGTAGVAVHGGVLRPVAARLVGQGLEHDVQGEAAERLGLQVTGLDDALEQAGVLRGVLGEEAQLGAAEVAEADQVVAVGVEEALGGRGEAADVLEERVELVLATLERLGGGDGVAQDGGDLGQHVGVDVGHLRGQPQVLDERRDLGVEAPEVAVDDLEVLADLVAASLEGGGDGVERHVDLGRLHGPQQRVEVRQHLLDLGGDLGALDGRVHRDALAGGLLGHDQGDVLLAEERLGDDRAGHVGGDLAPLVGVEAQREARPVGVGVDGDDLADLHAADLDVGAHRQLQADLGGPQGDLVVVGELLGEDAVRRPDPGEDQAEEDDAEHLVVARDRAQWTHGRLTPPVSRSWWCPRWPSTGTGRSR